MEEGVKNNVHMYICTLYVTEMLTNVSKSEKRNPIVKKLSLKGFNLQYR